MPLRPYMGNVGVPLRPYMGNMGMSLISYMGNVGLSSSPYKEMSAALSGRDFKTIQIECRCVVDFIDGNDSGSEWACL